MKTYLVGGAVRDRQLGLKIKDRDWMVTGATPEQMLEQGFSQVGADFPVFLHPETKEEYALARTERKSGTGYKGFEVEATASVTIEQDLMRRDLTINAMAEDDSGNIIDPYNGLADINQKLLRHVSPAFREDPLRVLRVARFAARFEHLGFSVVEETLTLMAEMVDSGELANLVPERVWQETVRALSEPSPWKYFQVLKACGALKVIFPEIDKLFGVPQKMTWHPEVDTGIHTLKSLQSACELSEDLTVRFATLCHDLGKGETEEDLLPAHHGHEQGGADLVKNLCRRVKAPNQFEKLAVQVCVFHTHSHRAMELKPSKLHDLLSQFSAFKNTEQLQKFLLCCEADSKGRSGFEHRPYPQAEFLLAMAEASKTVDVKALQDQGHVGLALGEAIRIERIRLIREAKSQW